MMVKEVSYETTEPTVDSQIVSLQGSGADVFVIAATPKFAAQAIRKSYDIGWKPVRYLTNVSPSIATVLKPAGLEKSKGLITGLLRQGPDRPALEGRRGLKEWADFMRQIHVGIDDHRRQRRSTASAPRRRWSRC